MTEILIGPDIAIELALLRQEDLQGHPLLRQTGHPIIIPTLVAPLLQLVIEGLHLVTPCGLMGPGTAFAKCTEKTRRRHGQIQPTRGVSHDACLT